MLSNYRGMNASKVEFDRPYLKTTGGWNRRVISENSQGTRTEPCSDILWCMLPRKGEHLWWWQVWWWIHKFRTSPINLRNGSTRSHVFYGTDKRADSMLKKFKSPVGYQNWLCHSHGTLNSYFSFDFFFKFWEKKSWLRWHSGALLELFVTGKRTHRHD